MSPSLLPTFIHTHQVTAILIRTFLGGVVYFKIIFQLKHETFELQFQKWRKNFNVPAEKDELEYIFELFIMLHLSN